MNGIVSARDAARRATTKTVGIVMTAVVDRIALMICATAANAFTEIVGRFSVTFAGGMVVGGRACPIANGAKLIHPRAEKTLCVDK